MRRCGDNNIRRDLREIGSEVGWIHLAQDRISSCPCENGNELRKKSGNFLIDSVTISFSRRTLLHVVS